MQKSCRKIFHPQVFYLREIKNKMIKSLLAVAAVSAISAPVMAGPYVNVETVASYSGDDYTGLATEFQIGYEGSNWYVSGGPIVSSPDNGESSTDFIGYVGGSLDLNESVGAYGEISLLTDEVADNAYGVKVGAKYAF